MSLFKRNRDEVAGVVLCLPRIDESILKRVPKGINVKPNGAVSINGNVIISELFGIRSDRLEDWKSRAPHGIELSLPISRDSATGQLSYKERKSAGEAAGDVVQHLLEQGLPLERVREFNYYTWANQELKVYLVVAGNLVEPPAGAVIGRLG